ncbi:MAG: ParB/RepB/Spo0J family partition protein [Candidatus Thermoplasmatota archaeon]|jgi:ParB family chromosome partitioning protein|nr:ParB/RepB/Spo0J family partition protein [Candidatus Thermoplasmatota archaeon]MDP7264660.1 ParB/RepB/Spo0J family partition protein [Candidatus Thermoplasmatota archaeon]
MKFEEIKMELIKPNPAQPRESFPKDRILELAKSIAAQGLLEPIVVRTQGKNYEIIAGERRWRAFSHLKKKLIPAIIWKIESDIEAAEKSLIENWMREDLTSVERENMLFQIKEMGSYRNSELASRLGLTKGTVGAYISAKKDRDKLHRGDTITTRDITKTRGLDDTTRQWLLDKLEKGEISKHEPEKKVRILKKAPEKLRKAIVEEKVDISDAKRLIDVGISEGDEDKLIEKLSLQKKAREKLKKIDIKMEQSGEKSDSKRETVVVRREDARDRERMVVYKEMWDNVRWWTTGSIRTIKDNRTRNRAVEYIKSIRDHCQELLKELEGE